MSTNIVPIGCVTTTDAKDAGFIRFSEHLAPVNSLEECIKRAEDNPGLCSKNPGTKNKNTRCEFVAYRDGRNIDLLRAASLLYDKSVNSQTEAEKKKYKTESLNKFQEIWLSYTEKDRQNQLNPVSGIPFLDDHAPWIKKNKNYMDFFVKNVSADRKPIQANNVCWIGGNHVLGKGHSQLIDFKKDSLNNPNCRMGLYMVPGGGSDAVAARFKKYIHQQAEEQNKKYQEYAIKAKAASAMADFISNPQNKNIPISKLFKAASETKKKVEINAATEDTRIAIENNLKQIQDSEKLINLVNSLANTSKTAINRNIDFVKDKQQLATKMNADLQSLNWSLEESENKEQLQNKITTTLGIIIMLFAGLCVGLMVYYLIGGVQGAKAELKNKSNKGVLNSIFGLGGTKTSSSNKKTLNSIFS